MALIRYAGYDPSENDFSILTLEDLRRAGTGSRNRGAWPPESHRLERDEGAMRRKKRAQELRVKGMGYTDIGRLLATEMGRDVPFQYYAVYRLVNKEKQNANDSADRNDQGTNEAGADERSPTDARRMGQS